MGENKEQKAEVLNIYQRFNKVAQEISGYIRKEKTVGEGTARQYKAVLYDHVVAHIRKAMFAAGIDVTPNAVDLKVERIEDKHGNMFSRALIKVELVFTNMDAPEDKIYALMWGMGDDYGDKAPGKALTYAVKAILLKKFLFESGEDEESYTVRLEMDDPISVDQLSWLRTNLELTETTQESFLGWFNAKYPAAYIEALDQLPVKYYPIVQNIVRKKLDTKKKE